MSVFRSEIDLNVPILNQHTVFRSKTHDDNWACWFTSALMVLYFRGFVQSIQIQTNLEALVKLWMNKGINPLYLGPLAVQSGLEHSPTNALFLVKSPEEWHQNLSKLGPLLMIVPGHAVVARGIINKGGIWNLKYNDPWNGMIITEPLDQAQRKIVWQCPMLYRRSTSPPPVIISQPVMEPHKIRY